MNNSIEMEVEPLSEAGGLIGMVDEIMIRGVRNESATIRIQRTPERLSIFEAKAGGDGLKETAFAPLKLSAAIITRFKILANMSIAQYRTVQVTEFNKEVDGVQKKIRAICLPTPTGGQEIILDFTA